MPKVGQGRSTFFPDHWTPTQVDNAVSDAFNSPGVVKSPNGRWTSSVSGVNMMGYYDTTTGALSHGFPYL